jgi:hypothetical protein
LSSFVTRATRESEAARQKDDFSHRQLIERLFDELERKVDAVAAAREPERA